MPRSPHALLLAAFLIVGVAEARGQAPLVVQARAGVLVPLGGFRDGFEPGGENGPGGSFGVAFALERAGGWHLYVGFSQHRVDCAADGCIDEGEHVATAWDLGARRDLSSGATVPWVRAGLTIPRVEIAGGSGRPDAVTELGIGGEAGAGVRFGVGGRFYLEPAVRLGAVDATIPEGPVFRMRYMVADLGIVIGF